MPRAYCVLIAVTFAPTLAFASGFGVPVEITESAYPVYLSSSVATDATGDATLAVLADSYSNVGVDHSVISTASRAAGSRWGSLGELFKYRGSDGITVPATLSTAGGSTTSVWEDAAPDGYTSTIYAADRPLGGSWTTQAAVTFVSASRAIPYEFIMDQAGDAAILFSIPQTPSHPTLAINVVRRLAGTSAWGPVETVVVPAAGTGTDLLASTMDEQGNISVAWHGYTLVCPTRCHETDHTLHVSRAAPGSGTWQDSGAIPGFSKRNAFFQAAITTDGKGHTAVGFLTPTGIAISGQHAVGAAWNTAVDVVTADPFELTLTGLGFVTVANGASDLVFGEYQTDTLNIAIDRVDGSIATNVWAPATTLVPIFPAQVYYRPQYLLGGSASGRGLLAWVLNDGTVQAMTTPSPQRGWGSSQTIVQGNGSTSPCACTVLGGVSIAATGRAAITYTAAFAAAPNQILYAVTN